MIRKILYVTGAVTLFTVFFVGKDAVSYVCTAAGNVRSSVKSAVPVDFEIERARQMVKGLLPEIRKNMHIIAKEEVEVARLEEQINNAEAKLVKAKTGLLRLKTDLAGSRDRYEYSGKSYTREQVKRDLANRFERFKTLEATAGSLQDIQQARTQSLQAARDKLEGMLAAKRQLEVDVEHLEAKLKMVEVAKTTSQYNFDDSRLGRAKELVSDLKSRLDIEIKLANAEDNIHGEIQLDNANTADIVDQVSEYFGTESPNADELAASVK